MFYMVPKFMLHNKLLLIDPFDHALLSVYNFSVQSTIYVQKQLFQKYNIFFV